MYARRGERDARPETEFWMHIAREKVRNRDGKYLPNSQSDRIDDALPHPIHLLQIYPVPRAVHHKLPEKCVEGFE